MATDTRGLSASDKWLMRTDAHGEVRMRNAFHDFPFIEGFGVLTGFYLPPLAGF